MSATRPLGIAGDFDFYRGEVDAGRPLASRVFHRLNAAIENAGSFRDHVESESEFVALVVTGILYKNTRWTVELDYKHSEYT